MEKRFDANALVDVDVASVGSPDVDGEDHQLQPIQSIVGLTKIARTGAKNVLTLPIDTRRIQPSRTWWMVTPTGAIKSPNDRQVQ